MYRMIMVLIMVLPMHSMAADCNSIGSLAKSVMETRQKGIPLGSAIEVIESIDNKAVSDLAKGMVLSAYKRPRYNTEENKSDSVIRFQNKWTLYCYEQKGE